MVEKKTAIKKIEVPFYWGQKIKLRSGDISGFVSAILLDEGSIQFKCSWMAEGKRQSDWFYEFELEPDGCSEKMTIGFSKTNRSGCSCKKE